MNRLDQDFFDRMVDGGLTPGLLREAVDRLDREPDGWKRCALAFLEAQCWRESFQALDEPARSRADHPATAVALRPAKPDRLARRWVRSIMAAGFIAASFALGWLTQAARPRSQSDQAMPAPAVEYLAQSGDSQTRPGAGTPGADGSLRPNRTDVALPRADWLPPDESGVVVALARLRIGSEGDSAEVPILAGPGINQQWLREQPPPVSEYAQALWQRRGYQVDQRRQLITTTLSDGRSVTVPIDQVEFRYTGNRPL
jgi:hypothetical protein